MPTDSTASFIFFEIVPQTKPLIVCGCHLVILAISAAVAPSLRRRNSITALFFDPSRASSFRDLAAGFACLEAGAEVFAAGFEQVWALGAAFFWLALVVAFLESAGTPNSPVLPTLLYEEGWLRAGDPHREGDHLRPQNAGG